MTNEKLKKKICDIIAPYVSAYGDDERIADALIAAGIGDVKEAEHRAKVAEKMFDILHEETSTYMKVFSKEWYRQQAEKELAEGRKK